MIYAPVLIPTLNRYEHLKRLIESLQRNKWAEFTELYIGVDFPPSEEYRKGYKKTCSYLAEEVTGFKKVNIYYHKSNFGVSNNIGFLRNEISKSYDRYILSEDDNEFSMNFLEYIDKGLEKFQNDEKIIGICGHAYRVNWGMKDNSLIKIRYAHDSWGIGRWIEKDIKLFDELTFEYLENLLCDINRALNLYRISPLLFSCCVEAVVLRRGDMYDEYGVFQPIDLAKGIYMIDRGYFTINPVLSKVRNWGDDGSGMHGGNENIGKNQPWDETEEFDFDAVQIYDDSQEIQKKMRRYLDIIYESKYKPWAWFHTYKAKGKILSLWLIYLLLNKIGIRKRKRQ